MTGFYRKCNTGLKWVKGNPGFAKRLVNNQKMTSKMLQ